MSGASDRSRRPSRHTGTRSSASYVSCTRDSASRRVASSTASRRSRASAAAYTAALAVPRRDQPLGARQRVADPHRLLARARRGRRPHHRIDRRPVPRAVGDEPERRRRIVPERRGVEREQLAPRRAREQPPRDLPPEPARESRVRRRLLGEPERAPEPEAQPLEVAGRDHARVVQPRRGGERVGRAKPRGQPLPVVGRHARALGARGGERRRRHERGRRPPARAGTAHDDVRLRPGRRRHQRRKRCGRAGRGCRAPRKARGVSTTARRRSHDAPRRFDGAENLPHAAEHEPADRVALRRRVVHAPVVHHQHPVGQGEHLVQVAGVDDHGGAGVPRRRSRSRTAAAARMSRPRVGFSATTSDGSAGGCPRVLRPASSRATTNFCWLPPESARPASPARRRARRTRSASSAVRARRRATAPARAARPPRPAPGSRRAARRRAARRGAGPRG
jgi:hypothetical protein